MFLKSGGEEWEKTIHAVHGLSLQVRMMFEYFMSTRSSLQR